MGKYVAVVQLLMGVQARARASLEQNRADLLPSDFGTKGASGDAFVENLEGGGDFGADLQAWVPTAEEAKEFIGLGGQDLSMVSSREEELDSAMEMVNDIIKAAEGAK